MQDNQDLVKAPKNCFVIMGYGLKKDPITGNQIDLDKSYQKIIAPAVKESGLSCIRCDQSNNSGLIDRTMYEYILNSDLVIADVTTLNANAMYELGVRHALKPYSTIIIAAKGTSFPFDVNHTAIFTYEHLGADIEDAESQRCINELSTLITDVLDKQKIDSPFYSTMGLSALSDLCKDEILRSYVYDEAFFNEHIICSLVLRWSDTNENDKKLIFSLMNNHPGDFEVQINKLNGIPSSPLKLNYTHWVYSLTQEIAKNVFPKINPALIARFKDLSVSVLSEKDPKFDLPKNERVIARVIGKEPCYSGDLRKGIAEALVYLSLYRDYLCESIFQQDIPFYVVYTVLNTSDWKVWGSLDNMLPILAEASPGAFLKALKNILSDSPETFSNIFDQEDTDFCGGTLITGLLWSLETIAWFPDMFGQVIECLSHLSLLDKGGRFLNRPKNSTIALLLPWINTTVATVEEKKNAVTYLYTNNPELLWNIVFSLLPNDYSTTSGCKKPDYYTNLMNTYRQNVTNAELYDLACFYSDFALKLASEDNQRILKILNNLNSIPPDKANTFFSFLFSRDYSRIPESEKYLLWSQVEALINKHKRYTDAVWHYPDEIIEKLCELSIVLKPTSNMLLYKPLFERNDFDVADEIYKKDENGDWDKVHQVIKERRQKAVKELIREFGVSGLLTFITSDVIGKNIGQTLAELNLENADTSYLPSLLFTTDLNLKEFISQYIKVRTINYGYGWLDKLNASFWGDEQKIRLLVSLPFEKQTWILAKELLGEKYNDYWKSYDKRPVSFDSDLTEPIISFLDNLRVDCALCCAFCSIIGKKEIKADLILEILQLNISSKNPDFDRHQLIELFKFLENDETCDKKRLAEIEFAYYPLFQMDYEQLPKSLYSCLQSEPEFFMQLICYVYVKESQSNNGELSEYQKALARISWNILSNFKSVPGVKEDCDFDSQTAITWINSVIELAIKNDRLSVTKNHIGQLFYHTPLDKSGLWIDKDIAQIYDKFENTDMRKGFESEAINSRGTHYYNPEGDPEKAIAHSWEEKADLLNQNGFYSFAQTARDIANSYLHFAQMSKNLRS